MFPLLSNTPFFGADFLLNNSQAGNKNNPGDIIKVIFSDVENLLQNQRGRSSLHVE